MPCEHAAAIAAFKKRHFGLQRRGMFRALTESSTNAVFVKNSSGRDMTTTQVGKNVQRSHSSTSSGGNSMVDEAKRNATAVAKVVEGRAEQGLDSAKEEAATRADTMASAVDTLARELRESDEGWLGDKAAAVAATLRRTGQHVQERRVDELVDDVREWSRNPAVFLGGAFALGLVAGRFLKSSGRHPNASTGLREPISEVTI